MNPEISKEFLFKYFDGQVTPIEKEWISAWAKDSANQEFFYFCLMQWENQNWQYKPDVQAAFDKHKARVKAHEMNVPIIELPKRNFWRFWVIAASISLFLTISGGYFYKDTLLFKTYTTGFGQIDSFDLADGTHVVLNANSSLRISRFGFDNKTKTRDVFLTGEANFEVTHTVDNQRFVVKTGKGFEVVVLGTVFSVFARSSGSKVILDKGKVQLNYSENQTNKQLTLKPGELVTLDSVGRANIKQVKNENAKQDLTAWKNNRFVFDKTPMSDLVTLFGDNFGLELLISDKELLEWTISGSFTAYTAEELLETLTQTANLHYEKNGKQIFISPN